MLKLLGKLVKFVGVCFIGFLIVGGCCAVCVDNGITLDTEPVAVTEEYNIEVQQAYSDGFALYIVGTLVADRNYEYLQIEIPVYDSEGNKVDTALANINNISKGETWKFEAMALNGSKYNINKAEVTGW